jgi:hypothetical protein
MLKLAIRIAPLLAVLVLAAPVAASSTLNFSAKFHEPVGGPNHSPFVCPPGTSCGSGEVIGLGQAEDVILFGGACGGACDLRTTTFGDGSTMVADEFATFAGVPGKSYNQPPTSYGHPFDVTVVDVIDGASSTGTFAGASGTLTGEVSVAGGMAIITLAGQINLA